MSRIGKQPIRLPEGTKVVIQSDRLMISGPKGELTTPVPAGIRFEIEDDALLALRADDAKQTRAYHGLARALAANAVTGVTDGFTIDLEIRGIGYRASATEKTLSLQVGYSHIVEMPIPQGVEVAVAEPTKIQVTGIDKQLVGEIASRIRRVRPPEVYKGKGIRYRDEVVQRKVGKAAGAL